MLLVGNPSTDLLQASNTTPTQPLQILLLTLLCWGTVHQVLQKNALIYGCLVHLILDKNMGAVAEGHVIAFEGASLVLCWLTTSPPFCPPKNHGAATAKPSRQA